MSENPLKDLGSLGQSLWLDYLRKDLITSGELHRLIEEDGINGVVSNPKVYEKAISETHIYDHDIKSLARKGLGIKEIYENLFKHDVQNAADEFKSIYRNSLGKEGYISIEIDPHLINDTHGTIEEARRLWKLMERPNVMIKIPASDEAMPAIQQLISEGINVNVTMLFGLPRYRQAANAYITGIESRISQNKPVKNIFSVAGFFINRIDTFVDPVVEQFAALGGEQAHFAAEMHGQVAISSAKEAYQIFKGLFTGSRFKKLEEKGANVQRLLWSKVNNKNPDFSDIKYIESLIGQDTIETVKHGELDAYIEHGEPKHRIENDLLKADWVLNELIHLDINIDDVVRRLEVEGQEKFNKPYERMLYALEKKSRRYMCVKL